MRNLLRVYHQKNLMNFTDLNRSYGAFGLLLSRLSNKEITWDQYEESIQRAKTYNTNRYCKFWLFVSIQRKLRNRETTVLYVCQLLP